MALEQWLEISFPIQLAEPAFTISTDHPAIRRCLTGHQFIDSPLFCVSNMPRGEAFLPSGEGKKREQIPASLEKAAGTPRHLNCDSARVWKFVNHLFS